MKKIFPFLLFCIFIVLSEIDAQSFVGEVQHFSADDGMPHVAVGALQKDAQGFLWLATGYGLSKYDGYSFKNFTKEEKGLFSNSHIVRIDLDEKGNLWLFHQKYLKTFQHEHEYYVEIFDPIIERVISLAEYLNLDKLPDDLEQITNLRIIDPMNTIWLTTISGALYSYKEGKLKKVIEGDGQLLNTLAVGADGIIWLSIGQEVINIDIEGRRLDSFTTPHAVAGLWPNADTLWIACYDRHDTTSELSLWYKKNGQQTIHPFGADQDQIDWTFPTGAKFVVHRNLKGIWHLKLMDQYYALNHQGKIIADESVHSNPLNEVKIADYLSEKDYTWFCTQKGIYRIGYNQNHFQPIHSREDLSDCRGIAGDSNGNIYFINRYLYHYDLKTKVAKKILDRGTTFHLSYVDSILITGTYGNDVLANQLNLKTRELKIYDSLKISDLYAMTATRWPDKYLVGTESGLGYLDLIANVYSPYEKYKADNDIDDRLQSSAVFHFHTNESGIWAATDNGVFLLDEEKGTVKHFNVSNGHLPFNFIRYIYEDQDAVYWLATRGGGVIRWQPSLEGVSKSVHFHTQNELPNDYTYAIYEDEYNKLWIPSDGGLITMDRLSGKVIKTYRTQDGLLHDEFNFPSHFQDKEGLLYFGGLGGLIRLDPQHFSKETAGSSQMGITRFALLEEGADAMLDKTKSLWKNNEINIEPGDKLIELQFSLLDFHGEDHHRYAYQIAGYSDQWNYIDENYLRITSLPYGDYNLKIKGYSDRSGWSENSVNLTIHVLKPFYLRSWFIALTIAAVFLMLYGAIRWRLWQMEKIRERLEAEVKKRTETIHLQAEELKTLDKAKTRFFSNITHELRTPLSLIIGPLEQITEEQPPPSIFRRRMKGIIKNARLLSQLINQLLDLSKIEGGKMKIEVFRGDIIVHTKDLCNRFQELAQKKGHSLNFVADSDHWVTQFDIKKWNKIVYNLLSNAIKFTPNGGEIQLSIMKIERQGNPNIRLNVLDSGIGIAKMQLDNIFNRFYQVDDKLTRDETGTGIGLALVKELIELQGGEIKVYSRVGKGTSFEIFLPVLASDISLPISEPAMELTEEFPVVEDLKMVPIKKSIVGSDNQRLDILIIEDNEEIREYIGYCLDRSRYHIIEATNGEEGIEKALMNIPDLIISDVMMPKVDGFEVVEKLRANISTSHIPIILLTAKASLESRLKGLEHGADAYLTKPFSPRELTVRIEKLIEVRRLLQERYQLGHTTPEHTAYHAEDEFIQELKAYILEHLEESNLNGDRIGKHFGISRVHLHRKLKALTNESISTFVKKIRLEEAKALVLQRKLNYSEIAYKTGFSNLSHFSKSFKKAFGKAPSKF